MKKIIVSAICCLVLLGSNVHGKQLSFMHFAKDTEFKSIKLSPNGKYFAAQAPKGNRTVLVVIDREAFKATTYVQTESREHVSQFYWANDERLVYKTNTTSDFDEEPKSYHQIFAMDADGGKHHVIFGYSQSQQVGSRLERGREAIRAWGYILNMLPKDEDSILVLAKHMDRQADAGLDIFKVNINTSRRKKITTTPFANIELTSDANGERIYGSGINAKGEFKSFIYENDEWSEIKSGNVLENYHVVAFSGDEKKLYLETHLNGETKALYEHDLITGKSNLLFNDPNHDYFRLLTDRSTGKPFAVQTMPGYVQTHYLDTGESQFKSYHKMVHGAFKNDNMFISSFTKDLKEMIVEVNNPSNSGDFYMFNSKKKTVDLFLSQRAWLDPAKMALSKPIEFKNRDGLSIHGYLTLPNKDKKINERAPLVVLVHGGPYGYRDGWYFDSEVQMLAHYGFAVLQVNYRGSGGYGLDFKETAYRDRAGIIQQDIIDGTKWVANLKQIDEDKICIMGTSFGAYSAVMAPVLEPKLFKCSVALSGFYDAVLQETTADYTRVGSVRSYARRIYGDDETVLRKQSPLSYPSQLITPTLIAHGGKDERTPPEHAHKLKKALDKVGTEY